MVLIHHHARLRRAWLIHLYAEIVESDGLSHWWNSTPLNSPLPQHKE